MAFRGALRSGAKDEWLDDFVARLTDADREDGAEPRPIHWPEGRDPEGDGAAQPLGKPGGSTAPRRSRPVAETGAGTAGRRG